MRERERERERGNTRLATTADRHFRIHDRLPFVSTFASMRRLQRHGPSEQLTVTLAGAELVIVTLTSITQMAKP